MNEPIIRIFRSPYELAEKFAWELVERFGDSAKRKTPFSVVLSGGSTPELLYSVLGDHFSNSVAWDNVHFFWSDERCVPPDSLDSNYGMARARLFDKIHIPLTNIHRIRGEDDPQKEAQRYCGVIINNTSIRDGLPLFDVVILGLGEDGHTASIFPPGKELFFSETICVVEPHPVSNQKRITITGKVINNADSVVFLVTGKKKAEILEKIINKNAAASNFPASYVVPLYGKLSWLVDEEAGRLL